MTEVIRAPIDRLYLANFVVVVAKGKSVVLKIGPEGKDEDKRHGECHGNGLDALG